MYNKKAFCKGLLCRRIDRKFTSYVSGKKLCSMCVIRDKKGIVTIDEYFSLKNHNVDWDKLNKEFDEMLKLKDEKKDTIINTRTTKH